MADEKRVFICSHLYDGEELFEDAELYLDAGRVARVLRRADQSPSAEALRLRFAGSAVVNEPDGIVLPGLINSHHHVYSALVRGMAVRPGIVDFPSCLEKLWWAWDRVLSREAVALSALVAAIDSVRHGCTAIVDHHSSPAASRGSLELIGEAFGQLGLRAVLCFETTDRNGPEALDAAIAENLEFAVAHANDSRLRGLFGLHASFTLCDESLQRVRREKPEDLPIHVHLAEDRCDVLHALRLGYEGPLARLERHELVAPLSLLAHGVHASSSEIASAARLGACFPLNPESNANNRVGTSDPDRFAGQTALLGTDGMSSNMLGALRFAAMDYAARGGRADDPCALAFRLLCKNPAAYLSRLFGCRVGRIAEGELADFALWRYARPTPLDAGNLAAHLVYGLAESPCCTWVYAGGRPVLEDRALRGVDEAAILAEAQSCAAKLWRAYLEEY